MTIIQVVIVIILVFLILIQPYLGIVFTAASLPVFDLLPPIPGFTSVVSLLGAITLVGFFLHRGKEPGKPLFRFGNVHILGLLLIGWIFVSNPQAAWFGTSRNWFFTFLQLWILMWLGGELLDTPQKHLVFMWVFSIATTASALFSIQNGKIGADISSSWRDPGLAEGANSAARFFIVAMVFLNYLRTVMKKRLFRLLALGGMVVTFLGVFYTVSRTGILLLFAAIGLMVLLHPRTKYRFQIFFVFIITMIGLWFLSNSITGILGTIIPSITQGTDTIGLRYTLWRVGLQMWLDHPLQGVGIGMYPGLLFNYAQPGSVPLVYSLTGLETHNMYIQMLAETGIIGFGLFALLIVISLRNIWNAGKTGDDNLLLLRNGWLIAFLVMLLGGMTKSDQVDKMVWLTMGVSVFFRYQILILKQKTAVSKMAIGPQNRTEGIIGRNGSKI